MDSCSSVHLQRKKGVPDNRLIAPSVLNELVRGLTLHVHITTANEQARPSTFNCDLRLFVEH
jgi:hypothetical protein